MQFLDEIKNAAKPSTAVGALYVGMLGLLLSDLIPTPADAVWFLYERSLRDRWIRHELTPRQYWIRKAAAYYGFNAVWWGGVLLGTAAMPGGIKNKVMFAGGVVGSGAVAAIIVRNIHKDQQEAAGSTGAERGEVPAPA